MVNLTNVWQQEEDMRVIAGGLLRISAPEMSQRFLPGRTPEAINMRLTFLRRPTSDELAAPQRDSSDSEEGRGSRDLLIGILRWAANRGRVPPGLTAQRTRELCAIYGVDIPSDGLKLRSVG